MKRLFTVSLVILAGLLLSPQLGAFFGSAGKPGFNHSNQERPVLDLNFQVSHGSLDSRITFTRASVAKCFDDAGVLTEFASDEARLPCYTYDGANWNNRGFLVEEARTNLAIRSEEVDNAAWTKLNVDITADDRVAPDGNSTADLLTDDATSGTHVSHVVVTVNNTDTYTASIFVRDGTIGDCQLRLGLSGNFVAVNFVFSSETISTTTAGTGTLVNSGVDNVGDGWYRIWVAGSAIGNGTAANSALYMTQATTYSGSGDTMHIWGSQTELGSFPTSYIATAAVTVTRAADVATMTDLSWLTPGIGTIYASGQVLSVGNGDTQYFVVVDEGNVTDAARIIATDTSDAAALQTVNSGGNNGFSAAGTIVANTRFKLAGSFSQDNITVAVDGVLDPTPDIVVDLPVSNQLTTLRIGTDSNGDKYLNGFLERFIYWSRRQADWRLQDRTAFLDRLDGTMYAVNDNEWPLLEAVG